MACEAEEGADAGAAVAAEAEAVDLGVFRGIGGAKGREVGRYDECSERARVHVRWNELQRDQRI